MKAEQLFDDYFARHQHLNGRGRIPELKQVSPFTFTYHQYVALIARHITHPDFVARYIEPMQFTGILRGKPSVRNRSKG